MRGRITNDKYENEIERALKEALANHSIKVRAEYDAILEDLQRELMPYYIQNEGKAFNKTRRKEIQNIIQRIVNTHHKRIREEVEKSSEDAAIIGFSGIQYQTEMKDKIKIPLAAMALSALHKDYKKRNAKEYATRKLSDGKNYNDRLRRNHGQLIIELTSKIGRGVTEAEGWIKLDKELKKSVSKVEVKTINIQRIEAERIKEEAAADAVKELKKVGIIKFKTWESRDDSRVRDTHADLHGTTIEENDYFETVNGVASGPRRFGIAAEDINCRCRLHWDTLRVDNESIERMKKDDKRLDVAYEQWKKDNGYSF